MRSLLKLLVPLCLILAAASSFAADFQAGVGRIKITPATTIRMAGYAARTSESLGVELDLWARALALQDAEGHRAVIVTTELIGLSGSITNEVCARAQRQYGLKRAELLIMCSHTHSGPVIRENLESMYDMNAAEMQHMRDYSAQLVANLTAAIGAALKDLAPAKLEVGHGQAGFAINRRQATATGVKIGVNPKGPVDHDVPILKVSAPDGKVRAIFFGYACHNTTIGGPAAGLDFYKINGDYAGFAAADLESRFPGAAALFTILCGADQNPNPRGALAISKQHGKELADETARIVGAKMRQVNPPLQATFETIKLEFAPHTRQTFVDEIAKNENVKTGDKYRVRRARAMLADYDKNKPVRELDYPIQAIRLGDFTLVALGGEVVVDYALRTKKEFAGRDLMVIGYANEVMSYIPTRRVLSEGGYEPDISMIYYGLPGPYAESVEERIMAGIHKALGSVGVKPAKE